MHLSVNSKGWKKWLVVSWSFVEVFLFGGLLFGWGSLVFVFKDEGIYANLCERDTYFNKTNATAVDVNTTISDSGRKSTNSSINTTTTESVTPVDEPEDSRVCKAQDAKFALCFTIASAMFSFSSAIMGQINYRYGTRVTRLVAFNCFTAGSLLLAFVSIDVPWMIFPGLSLIAVGGLPIIITDVQVSNIFTKGRATIVTGLCGLFDISAGVQLIVKLAHDNGFSRQNMYLVITGVHTMTLISTFGFLPKMFIPNLEDEGKTEDKKLATPVESSVMEEISAADALDVKSKKGQDRLSSRLNCIKQPEFITHCIWFCVIQLKVLYFLGSLNTYLNRVLDANKQKVSYFTNVGLYIMMGGLMSSFLAGIIYDWQKNMCKGGFSEVYRKVTPAVLPLALGSIMCLSFSVMTIFKSETMIYPVFVCMTLARSFVYGIALAFLNAVFPSECFGFLCGVVYPLGGAFSFLQYAFFTWAETYPSSPIHADIVLLILVCVSLCHPGYIWFMCTRQERKYREKHQNEKRFYE